MCVCEREGGGEVMQDREEMKREISWNVFHSFLIFLAVEDEMFGIVEWDLGTWREIQRS